MNVFKSIVDSYSWDFCQIQLNYMDRHYQAGIEGMKYVADKNISLVIMEPIKGGKLSKASNEISQIWNRSTIKRTPSEWALKRVLNFKEVSVVLSGMSTMEHVIENIHTTSVSSPNSLTIEELALIDEVTNIYLGNVNVECTGCEYCLPCPQNVEIPDIFELYNDIYVYGAKKESKNIYNRLVKLEKSAQNCIKCGACESICPQHIDIIKSLKSADKILR